MSSLDRQRINHALTYFLYAQANRQLVRIQPGLFSVRTSDQTARAWVIRSLKQPQQLVAHDKMGGHGGFQLGFDRIGVSAGGGLEHWYVANPRAPFADMIVQLFDDGNAHWDGRGRFWHLSKEYKDDYEWARNEDRFHFFLAFYQDPYPATVFQ